MFYQGAGAHFVAFHPRRGGKFALYDSAMSREPREPIDPVEFAKAKISGESDLNLMKNMFGVDLRANDNTVVVLRPARNVFETRRALALPMTIDKIPRLDGAGMTLLKNFLEVATDPAENGALGAPAAQPDADEKHAVVTDEAASDVQQAHDQQADSKLGGLSADFPKLAALARRVGAMGAQARGMQEERAAMRDVVDEAFQQIAPMQRVEQLRLFARLGIYREAQARQNYTEHVVQQHWPRLADEYRDILVGAVRQILSENEQCKPRGRVLDADDCTAIEQLTISKADELLGLEAPAQALNVANDVQTGGPAQTGGDAADDEKVTQ
jgi:hypothetical protein